MDPEVDVIVSTAQIDVRDVNIHRVESLRDPSILQVGSRAGGTLVRGADGQWTWVPLLAIVVTRASVALIGVAINAAAGDDPPAAVTPTAANRILTDVVKGCLSRTDQSLMELTFIAVPGADLELAMNNPDRTHYIPLEHVAERDLFTVTITATGGFAGSTRRWAVDISTADYVPYPPQIINDKVSMYVVFGGHGCTEMY